MSLARHIDELIGQEATFAAFRIPGEDAVAYLQHDVALGAVESKLHSFVLAPFEHAGSAPLCIRADEVLRLNEASDAVSGTHVPASTANSSLREGMDRNAYRAAVARAVEAIKNGEASKVVLARTLRAELQTTTPGALFEAAAAMLPNAFVALVRTERYGLWLGASPERLVQFHQGTVEVDSLAGTLPSASAPTEAQAWGNKEREEQAWVTRMVLDTLARAGVQNIQTHGPLVKQAGPVAHLHTRITGSAKDLDPLELARMLHPTPAVGGTPSDAALSLIHTLEPRPRSLYAGYWGPHDAQHTQLFVNLRCMELFPGEALLHVGAGITGDSDPDAECEEVERKAATWTRMIHALRSGG